jgi:hypothetical protein
MTAAELIASLQELSPDTKIFVGFLCDDIDEADELIPYSSHGMRLA